MRVGAPLGHHGDEIVPVHMEASGTGSPGCIPSSLMGTLSGLYAGFTVTLPFLSAYT